ncbi:MAG: hypothetical protein ACQERB_14005 [Promethearchaeati archaeon]
MDDLKAIEGDYLQTKRNDLFFDVKGVSHPKDRTICFIRFYPDPEGERQRKSIRYSKIYDLEKRYSFLQKHFPQYIFFSEQFDMQLQGVKNSDIKRIYHPRNYFKELQNKSNINGIKKDSYDLCKLFIENSNLSSDSIGITGSQMIGLQKSDSDIDLIIYGTQQSLEFQTYLPAIFEAPNEFRHYKFEEYKSHYKFRAGGSGISFNDFMKSEIRKLHQGIFKDIEFFIRYIKSPDDWTISYYDCKYENFGRIRLKAEITDAKDCLFTPATYKINALRIIDFESIKKDIHVDNIDLDSIREVNSFRGRFCEHAKKGELVMVEGKFEKVTHKKKGVYYRILLGNSKIDKMILIAK